MDGGVLWIRPCPRVPHEAPNAPASEAPQPAAVAAADAQTVHACRVGLQIAPFSSSLPAAHRPGVPAPRTPSSAIRSASWASAASASRERAFGAVLLQQRDGVFELSDTQFS